MPLEVVKALALIKQAAAVVNARNGKFPVSIANAIQRACQEIHQTCTMDENFPLRVWQTGSGTQTNMNVNEVVANRAIQLLGGVVGSKQPVHPNDHVNASQSSNDTFPTAMHISVVLQLKRRLLPVLEKTHSTLVKKADEWKEIVKIGRTHLQDATPLTLGQEFGAFAHQILNGIQRIESCMPRLLELAQGGTAVGTGLNTFFGFDEQMAAEISKITLLPFCAAKNKVRRLY